MLKLKEGDIVVYQANMPYTLANGQLVNKKGDELMIKSDVVVQKKFFNKVNKKVNKNETKNKVENKKEDKKNNKKDKK